MQESLSYHQCLVTALGHALYSHIYTCVKPNQWVIRRRWAAPPHHTKAPGMQCTKHLWGGTAAPKQEGCWTYRRWHQMWDLSVGFLNGKPDVWDGLLDHVRWLEHSFPVERRKSHRGVLCATVFNISVEKHRWDYGEQENRTSLEYEMFEVVWFFISSLHDCTFLNRNETFPPGFRN